MTSRLKHKLQDVEVSSNYNESFCQIGTPLPALADTKKKDAGEYVPVWKQEVTDEQGRRRLHGAFTGGFSAGYFNTVGSKEGWAPSAFVSSRTNRASATQKAEDFMDDEDKAEMRADQKLETRQGFGLEDKKPHDGAEGVPDYLSSLVQPSSSAIGVKLLTKLGWRPGQGVGPRVTARALERQDAKTSLYDRSLGHGGKGAGNAGNDDGLDEEAKKHLFAPRDTPLRVYPPKDGTEGLGWAKGAGLNQPSTRDNVDINESGEGPKRTGGFGYGLEDADEDDADVYATGPSSDITSGRGRFAFHQDDGDDEILQMGSRESKKTKKPLQPSNANASTSTWHDGRPVVRGFTVAAAPVKEDRWFSPLEVPKGWTPKPSRVWDRGKKWDLTPSQAAEKVENAGKEREVLTGDEAWRRRQAMTSDTRGALLGEQQTSLPPPPPKTTSEPPLKASAKSVFEFMSAKDRERIASFAAAQAAGPSVSSDSPAASEPRPPSPAAFTVPTVDAPTANSALHGFMPFGEDPAKQARYRSYLSSQATGTDPTGVLLTRPGQTQEQLFHELSSFQKAAQIFRPLSVSMSSRFTSSSSAAASVETQPIKAGLFVMDAETRAARLKEKEQQAEEDRQAKLKPIILENETAMQQAARMGMYGTMTRETKDFFPVKLLCKRFGVKDPHPEGPSSADDSGAYASAGSGLKPIVDPNAWQSKFIHVTPLSQVDSSAPAESSAAQAAAVALQSVTADPKAKGGVSLGEEGELEKEAAKLERPPMDIFKAIFASDDEDSSDEEEEQHLAPSLSAKLAAPAHSTASLPPPASSTIVESDDEDVVGPLKPPPPSSLSASLDPTGMAFRPTFNVAPKASLSSSASKDKKKKKKKEKKAIVSFGGEDEDEDEASAGATVERERTQRERRGMKRTRESEAATASTEEEIWVEKPAALTVEGAAEEQDRQILDGGAGLKRARRTAADFL